MDDAVPERSRGRLGWWVWLIIGVIVLVVLGTITRAVAAPLQHEMTSLGLTARSGQAACDVAGKKAFPAGYNPSWVAGQETESIQNDEWYFSYTAKVTGQDGAKSTVDIECRVTGADDQPEVTTFAYS